MADEDVLYDPLDDEYGGIFGVEPDSPLDEVDMDEVIATLMGRARTSRKEDESLRALKRHLHTHPIYAEKLERKERRLREIVLQAAEYGLREMLEKALPVLRRVYDTHSLQTGGLLDFYDEWVRQFTVRTCSLLIQVSLFHKRIQRLLRIMVLVYDCAVVCVVSELVS